MPVLLARSLSYTGGQKLQLYLDSNSSYIRLLMNKLLYHSLSKSTIDRMRNRLEVGVIVQSDNDGEMLSNTLRRRLQNS